MIAAAQDATTRGCPKQDPHAPVRHTGGGGSCFMKIRHFIGWVWAGRMVRLLSVTGRKRIGLMAD